MDSGELLRASERVHLTSREKDILRVLAKQSGKAVARMEFASGEIEEGARAIDVQINRLRQKIERDTTQPQYLQTIRGQGYCLIAEGVFDE